MRGGPRRFPPDFSCPVVLRVSLGARFISYTGLSPSLARLSSRFYYKSGFDSMSGPYNPIFFRIWFGLFPFRSPLLWKSLLFSFPMVTEMVQFTTFALPALCIQAGVIRHYPYRVSPFGHLRINARLPAPRSFSQAATSFIACYRQGIHHMHLFA